MNKASVVYCSGKYKDMRTVFTCMGKCDTREAEPRFAAKYHCADCTLLLWILSRVGIGEAPRDTMIARLVQHNAIVGQWQSELHKEVRYSTVGLPYLLNNAIQARGISVVWQVHNRAEIAAGTAFEDPFTDLAWRGSAMSMHVNTCAPGPTPCRHRLHIVPHNAGLMLRDLVLLPFDAAPADAVNIIDRHTLPLEAIP